MFPEAKNESGRFIRIPIATDSFESAGAIVKGMCGYADASIFQWYEVAFKEGVLTSAQLQLLAGIKRWPDYNVAAS